MNPPLPFFAVNILEMFLKHNLRPRGNRRAGALFYPCHSVRGLCPLVILRLAEESPEKRAQAISIHPEQTTRGRARHFIAQHSALCVPSEMSERIRPARTVPEPTVFPCRWREGCAGKPCLRRLLFGNNCGFALTKLRLCNSAVGRSKQDKESEHRRQECT